jgi:hypothetical protein
LTRRQRPPLRVPSAFEDGKPRPSNHGDVMVPWPSPLGSGVRCSATTGRGPG